MATEGGSPKEAPGCEDTGCRPGERGCTAWEGLLTQETAPARALAERGGHLGEPFTSLRVVGTSAVGRKTAKVRTFKNDMPVVAFQKAASGKEREGVAPSLFEHVFLPFL